MTGVSYATVSRVLNGRDRTSEATRAAVLKVAAEHNFRPRMQARKKSIGLLMDLDRSIREEKNGYMDIMVLKLLNDLSNRKFSVEIFTPHSIGNLKDSLLEGVAALVWSTEIAEILEKKHITNKVLINTEPIGGCSRVYSDHAQGGELAAQYLIDNGHTCAGIVLDARNWGNNERLRGFVDTFSRNGIPLKPSLSGFLSEQSEISLIPQILNEKPSAIFLAGEDNILQLVNTVKVLQPAGAKISLITMENPSISRFMNPALTTVAQPFKLMIDKTVEILVNGIEGDDVEPVDCRLDNNLVVRSGIPI